MFVFPQPPSWSSAGTGPSGPSDGSRDWGGETQGVLDAGKRWDLDCRGYDPQRRLVWSVDDDLPGHAHFLPALPFHSHDACLTSPTPCHPLPFSVFAAFTLFSPNPFSYTKTDSGSVNTLGLGR